MRVGSDQIYAVLDLETLKVPLELPLGLDDIQPQVFQVVENKVL